jgi:predicted DNA-binding transcriptional regulator AlpA
MEHRNLLTLNELIEKIPLTINQIYKAVRRRDYPLPHRKSGKRLLFDLDEVYTWFDLLPGINALYLNEVVMKIGEIESGIEVPVTDRRSKYPWHKMGIGDSVLFKPDEDESHYKLMRTVANSSKYFGEGQIPEWKFITRRLKDNTVRVWRVK